MIKGLSPFVSGKHAAGSNMLSDTYRINVSPVSVVTNSLMVRGVKLEDV